MTRLTTAISLLGLWAGAALAQPGTSGLPEDLEDPVPPPAGDPQPPPPPPPPPPAPEDLEDPVPPPGAIARPAPAPTPSRRPTGRTLGLGAGYSIPADLSTPNLLSARFRLASGLTFEPGVVLNQVSQTSDDGGLETTDRTSEFELGTAVRYPLRSRGRVDFSLIGAASLSRFEIDPAGSDNSQTVTRLAVSWGIGLDYWLAPHWGLSMTATNPLVTTSNTTFEAGPGAPESTDSSTAIGAIFKPRLAVMVHLYL